MENTEKETNKSHPKPSEDVQLNIETVIPDTEKETLPSGSPDQPEEPKEPAAQQQPEEQDTHDTPEEPGIEQEKPSDTEKGKDDARDAIETVSP